MYKVIFLTDALNDLETAVQWYEQQQQGLSIRLIEYISAAIEKIQSDKVVLGPVYRDLSRVLAKQFPYVIYFKKKKKEKQIVVFSVLHKKQSLSNIDKRF